MRCASIVDCKRSLYFWDVSAPPFLAHAGKMAKKPLLGPFLRVKTHIIIKAPKVCAAYGF